MRSLGYRSARQTGTALLAVLGASLACAGAAQANTTPQFAYFPVSGVPSGAQPSVSLAIDVTATVGGTCGFRPGSEPNANINAGQIDVNAWSQQVPFTAQCTAPWRIAVSSLNGALKTGTGTAAPGYTALAPYTVGLNVNSDGGVVTGTCPVADLAQSLGTSSCVFKGPASTAQGLYVVRSFDLPNSFIQVSAPAYTGSNALVAGTYTDTLTVTVSPAT